MRPTNRQPLATDHSLSHDEVTSSHTGWFITRLEELLGGPTPPLVVPLTVSFRPNTIRPAYTLREFERFYARLARLLVVHPERANRRHLLPFCLAYRDDPSTRRKVSRPVYIDTHPEVAPHVHATMLIHPDTVDRFKRVAGSLGVVWQSLSPWRNGTLRMDGVDRFEAWLADYDRHRDEIRARLKGWIGYSSKLYQRPRAALDGDVYTALPPSVRILGPRWALVHTEGDGAV